MYVWGHAASKVILSLQFRRIWSWRDSIISGLEAIWGGVQLHVFVFSHLLWLSLYYIAPDHHMNLPPYIPHGIVGIQNCGDIPCMPCMPCIVIDIMLPPYRFMFGGCCCCCCCCCCCIMAGMTDIVCMWKGMAGGAMKLPYWLPRCCCCCCGLTLTLLMCSRRPMVQGSTIRSMFPGLPPMQFSQVALGLWLGWRLVHTMPPWLQSAPWVQQLGFPFLLATFFALPRPPVLPVLLVGLLPLVSYTFQLFLLLLPFFF